MRHVVLLRGVNLGPTNRVPMPELREALTDAGFAGVRTYVQSGNIVLDSDATPGRVASDVRHLIAGRYELDVPVITRSRDELAQVVERNPLADVAIEPKRYQVSFLSGPLAPEVADKLQEIAAEPERVAVVGREIYAWHPNGVARSKLWNKLGSQGGLGSGVTATSRNWTTVTTLLEMADGG